MAVAVALNLSQPLTALLMPRYSLVLRGTALLRFPVTVVLAAAAQAKVAPSVVQRIVVDVVADLPGLGVHDLAGHTDGTRVAVLVALAVAHCIITFGAQTPKGTPLVFVQSLVVRIVADGHLTLRQFDRSHPNLQIKSPRFVHATASQKASWNTEGKAIKS